MTGSEKAELLKSTIFRLFSKEGRSKVYISKLLEIDRKTLTQKIKEWNFPEPKPVHHQKPSNVKFTNKNRTLIKARLDNDVPITKIAEELGVTRYYLQKTIIPYDDVLNKAKEDYVQRMHLNAAKRIENLKETSCRNYITDLDGEIWKNILGYEEYQVSNYGRVRKMAKKYNSYYEIKPCPNKNNGRLYVKIGNKDSSKNLNLARVVAHTFVPGYSDECNTVNHIDGNVTNNSSSNLEWVNQSDNNKHSYKNLNRKKSKGKSYKFSQIIYDGKYEFKTITAFAKFIGKSETQVRRYLNEPDKYNIKLIK